MKKNSYIQRFITAFLLMAVFTFSTATPSALASGSSTQLNSALLTLVQTLQAYRALLPGRVLGATTVVVTTSAELNTAIASATGGETIQLAPGTYGQLKVLSKTYTTPVTFTSLDQNNRAVISSFNILASNNVVIDGINVKYTYPINQVPPPVTWTKINEIKSAKNCVIRNMNIIGDVDASGYGALYALDLSASSNITFEKNLIKNWNIGIVLAKSNNIIIDNNEFTQISGDGLENVQVQFVTISNNYFHDFLRPPTSNIHADMIQFWTMSSNVPSTDVTIIGNRLDIGNGSWTQSIFMRNEAVDMGTLPASQMNYRNFRIENNTITNLHLNGITLGQADGVIIRGNTLISAMPNTSTDPTTLNFLKQYSANNPIFSPAIRPSFFSNNVLVENNTFLGQPNNSPTNLRLTGYVTQPDWTVRNNTVNGVQISGGTGTPTPIPTTPILTLSASAASVAVGGSATLTWSSVNATACTASGDWTGSKTVSGSQSTGALATVGGKIFVLTCTGSGGPVIKSVSVNVTTSTLPPIPTKGTYNLIRSTYLDGSIIKTTPDGMTRDVAFDVAGNMYVTGGTKATDFPTTVGAYDQTYNSGGKSLGRLGDMDIFVMKFDPQGNLLWSTLLGGPNYDRTYALEVGPTGEVVVAGRAGEGFPTTSGVVQPTFLNDSRDSAGFNTEYGRQNGFVTKFDTNGTLQWSSYFSAGVIRDMDIDNQGNIHLVPTESPMPTPYISNNAFQKTIKGSNDGMYAKVTSDGKSLLYGTYIGGTGKDGGNPAVRVNAAGEAYYSSWSASTDFPTKNAAQATNKGLVDTVLAKFAADGSLIFSTYFGGSKGEMMETHALAIDAVGNAYLGGSTQSTDINKANGADTTLSGTSDAFVAKFSPTGTLLGSTYLGGNSTDMLEGMVFNNTTQELVITGTTGSSDFAKTGGYDVTLSGTNDGYMTKLSTDLSAITYATYRGGTGVDELRAVDVYEPTGAIIVGGITRSGNLPLVNALDSVLNSSAAADSAVFAPTGVIVPPIVIAPTVVLTSSALTAQINTNAMLTWSSANAAACVATGNWSGVLGTSGSQLTGVLSTLGTKTFGITCTGIGGTVSNTVTLNVTALPVVTSPFIVGQRVQTIGAVNVRATAGGSVLGTQTDSKLGTVVNAGPTISGEYTYISVNFDSGFDGWVADAFVKNAMIVVPPTSNPPTITFTNNPTQITAGKTSVLTWSTTDATSCTSSGTWDPGTRGNSGTFTTSPLVTVGTKVYTLTCTGSGGSVSKNVTLVVTATTPLPVDTDKDTVVDSVDNCSTVANTNQANFDADTQGDVCDQDDDNDGILDTVEKAGCVFDTNVTCGVVKPPTISFTATDADLQSGETGTLTWITTDASSCVGSGTWGNATRATAGTFTTDSLNAVGTKPYTLVCTGTGGSVTKTVNLIVRAVPIVPTLTLTSTPKVLKGGSATLNWSSTNVTTCTASDEWQGTQPTSGSYVKTNRTSLGKQTFTLTCTGTHGSVTKSAVSEVVEKLTTSIGTTVGQLVSSTLVRALVTTKDGVRVRTSPNGSVVGLQPKGASGTSVSEESTVLQGYTWVRVDFPSGPDGYVAKELLNVTEPSAQTLQLEQLNALLLSLQLQLRELK